MLGTTLIARDYATVRDSLSNVLKKCRYTAAEAVDVEVARDVINQKDIQGPIIDIMAVYIGRLNSYP
jgi:DNA-binding NtrC family response regulator